MDEMLNSPEGREYLCNILRQLDPCYVAYHQDVLDAMREFLSRASEEQLNNFLSKTVFRGRLPRGQAGLPIPDVTERRNPFQTPSRSSYGVRSTPGDEDTSSINEDARPLPRLRFTLRPMPHHQAPSRPSQTSTRSPRSVSDLASPSSSPDGSAARGTSAGSNASHVAATEAASSRTQPDIDPSHPDPSRRDQLDTLRKIVKTLPDTDAHISADLKSDPQRLWTDSRAILSRSTPVEDAREQYGRLRRGEEQNAKEKMLVRIRDRMLKILQGDQLRHMQERIRDSKDRNVEDDPRNRFGIPAKRVRTLSASWKRYVALMEKFGPGTIMVLSGSHTDWLRLTNEHFEMFTAYVQKYRQNWMSLARSLDFLAASGLAHAMLMVGMPPHRLAAGDTPITSIVVKYIHVQDGSIRPNRVVVAGQSHPAPSLATETGNLAEMLRPGSSAGTSEHDTSMEEHAPSDMSDVLSRDPDETERAEPAQPSDTPRSRSSSRGHARKRAREDDGDTQRKKRRSTSFHDELDDLMQEVDYVRARDAAEQHGENFLQGCWADER